MAGILHNMASASSILLFLFMMTHWVDVLSIA